MSFRRTCFKKWPVVSGQWPVISRLSPLATCFLLFAVCFLLFAVPSQAQFIDPQGGMIINVLREIAFKHQLALDEQRLQTAKMVQQLKQFYDTYTLLRQDVEFTQSLYRDFKAIENMRMNNSFAISNFILNADRLNYWFPSTTQDVNRSVMDTEALLNNAEELRRTYESFALSTRDQEAPKDAETRRENALIGQEAFSRALFEQALRNQQMAKTYDSMAVELYRQVKDSRNKFTEAERMQLLLESVKLRDKSNEYYSKYLELAQSAHTNELNMFDQKLDLLRSKANWKAMKSQVNKTSKIRYGFFDITSAMVE
ncbi:MAG: hypothetical protein ONB44_13990 [candidate division KSB1 bacterium]|nr:hypothetical protein [candidate division KSB1 bacterium]MDZ7303235.1 hypothetical protein [candidate division KSB1 bacterium]MDZ7312153.1 hypothetical protein [candidate division KSB1 bacterium]